MQELELVDATVQPSAPVTDLTPSNASDTQDPGANRAAAAAAATAASALLAACGGGGGTAGSQPAPLVVVPLPREQAAPLRFSSASSEEDAARFLQQAPFSSLLPR